MFGIFYGIRAETSLAESRKSIPQSATGIPAAAERRRHGSFPVLLPLLLAGLPFAAAAQTQTVSPGNSGSASGSITGIGSEISIVGDADPGAEPRPGPGISITGGAAVTEGGDAIFTLAANPAPESKISFVVNISQDGDFAGPGQGGRRTVVIDGRGVNSFVVATIDDELQESEGLISATVSGQQGYDPVPGHSVARVAVRDDDSPPVTPVASVSGGGPVTEGGGAGFRLATNPPAAGVEVHLLVSQRGEFAAEGETGWRTVITGAEGEAEFAVATSDDAMDEPDGQIVAAIVFDDDYTADGEYNTARVRILDDDEPAPPPTRPVIGAAKELLSAVIVDKDTLRADFRFHIRNYGDGEALNVRLEEDFSANFAEPLAVSVSAPPSAAGGALTPNPGFNGYSDTALLAGTDTLAPNAAATVELSMDIALNGIDGPFANRVLATAMDTGGEMLADLSHAGANPDPDGDGDPTEHGENDFTVIEFSAAAAGEVFADRDADGRRDESEAGQSGWGVEVRDDDGELLVGGTSGAQGGFAFSEVAEGAYRVQARHPDSGVVWSEMSLQTLPSSIARLDFPIASGGVVYDSVSRAPIPGVSLRLLNSAGKALAEQCLLPGQQGQTTGADGAYRFELIPGAHGDCPAAAMDYRIEIAQAPAAYLSAESFLIPAESGALDAAACAARSSERSACVVQSAHTPPAESEDSAYYLAWTLGAEAVAAFHNHVPLDPRESPHYGGLISVSKEALRGFVAVGEPVGYEVRLVNTTSQLLRGIELRGDLPNEFNFIEGSATLLEIDDSAQNRPGTFSLPAGDPVEIEVEGGDPLRFGPFDLAPGATAVVRYATRASTRASQGGYVSSVTPFARTRAVGNTASAVVNVASDPLFEQTSIVGRVFLDEDGDGEHDEGEPGVAGVRLATVEGLLIETDRHGRYHLAAVEVGNAARGANFIIKLDPQSLPAGAEVLGENPRVLRITESLMSRIDFALRFPESHQRELRAQAPASVVIERTVTRYNNQRIEAVRFESGFSEIPPEYVEQLQRLLDAYADRDNLRVRFVGHTDDTPLSARIAPIYGDNQGLSEARAMEVAEFVGGQLGLDPAMVEIEGRSFLQPIASNATEEGRALNRRVEIEIVFDEEIIETSEEFEPDDPAEISTEPVTETSFESITDNVEPVRFAAGETALSADQLAALEQNLAAFAEFEIESVSLVGFTDQSPGASDGPADEAIAQANARAENVAAALSQALGVSPGRISAEGVTTTERIAVNSSEFAQSLNRRVEIELSYQRVVEVVNTRTIVVRPAQMGPTAFVEGAGRVWMTEDAFSREARLSVLALGPIVVGRDGRMAGPARFSADGNYGAVAERYRLDFYRAGDVDLAHPISSLSAGELDWPDSFALFDESLALTPGERIAFVLRAFDASGNEDFTAVQLVDVLAANTANTASASAIEPEAVLGTSILASRQINPGGSRVRVHGAEFEAGERLRVAGETVQADVNGSFVTELFLAEGDAEILVAGGGGDNSWEETLRPEIDGDYSFLVGLASLTIGQDSFSGNFEALSGAEEFDESVWLDGRLAFYAKARIQGKYLLTAQIDSTEDDIENFGDNLRRRDPRSMFRQLDPDRYYPVYGDDSTTVSDVDTQGALYVRLDWNRNQLLWGNFNTGMTDTGIMAYNRSLYGARVQLESDGVTALGDPGHSVTAFASETESAAAHVSFRATGGSIYYLRHTDVVQGSEKVWMEVRQRDSRQVIERREYTEGLDYEIDPIQGRIILRQPLQPVTNDYSNTIIRPRGIGGDEVHLLVDYEFVPAGFSGDNLITGARGKVWLGDHIGIGAASIRDDSGGEDHQLEGVDLTLKSSEGTYLNLEAARSEAARGAAGFESFDGGLRFNSMDYSLPGQMSAGDAISVEGRLDIADLSETFSGNVRAWWKDRDPGFASGNITLSQLSREAGVDALIRNNDGSTVQASVSEVETVHGDESTVARLQGDVALGRVSVGGEIRYEDLRRSFGRRAASVNGDALMVGARAGYALNADQTLYAKVQTGLTESGGYVENDRLAAGLETQISDNFALLVEASAGDRGSALSGGVSYAPVERFSFDLLSGVGAGAVSQFGGNYRLANGHELYASYLSDPDRTFGEGDMMDGWPAPRFRQSLRRLHRVAFRRE